MGRRASLLLGAACVLAGVTVIAQAVEPLPDGAAKEIVEKQCSTCHSLEVIVTQRRSADEWTGLVQNMLDRGAEIDQDEVPVIAAYLTTHWSKSEE